MLNMWSKFQKFLPDVSIHKFIITEFMGVHLDSWIYVFNN